MSDQQMASIEAADLRKEFGGNPVLRQLSLAVRLGTIFGLFGESGLGKSTCVDRLREAGYLRRAAVQDIMLHGVAGAAWAYTVLGALAAGLWLLCFAPLHWRLRAR